MSWSGGNRNGLPAQDRAGARDVPVGLTRDMVHVGAGLALGACLAAVLLTHLRREPAAWVVITVLLAAARHAWVRLARRESEVDPWTAADAGPDDDVLVDLAALERAAQPEWRSGSEMPVIRQRSPRDTPARAGEQSTEAGSLLATALASIGLDQDVTADEGATLSEPDEAEGRSDTPSAVPLHRARRAPDAQPRERSVQRPPEIPAPRPHEASANGPRQGSVPGPVLPAEPGSASPVTPPRGRHAGRQSQPGQPAARHASGVPLRRVPRQRRGGAEPPVLPPPLAHG
jgi:hypothetical protein